MLKYTGLAIAFSSIPLGLSAPGINGKTIVCLLMWIVGVVMFLRARKLEMDAERRAWEAAQHAEWAEGVDRGIAQMSKVHGGR